MNRSPSTLAVASAADARYALPLAVMLNSVGSHAGPDVRIEAYVLDDGVSAEDKLKVAASVPANVQLKWRQPVSTLTGLPTWGRMPLTPYQKLTVGDWIPEGTSRAIWLDCDLLILEDISPLWSAESGNHAVLAVPDQRVPLVSSQFGVAAWRELGLPAEAKYFNAGVLVIDLAHWREEEVCRRALDYLGTYGDRIYFWDQEALNAVLVGKWGELDACWNRHPSLNHVLGRQSLRRACGLDQHAPCVSAIVHFSGHLKPWNRSGNGPYQALYQRYLNQTAWADQRANLRWQDQILTWYETSHLRRLLYPTERLATMAERSLTRKYPK